VLDKLTRTKVKVLLSLILILALVFGGGCSGTDPGAGSAPPGGQAHPVQEVTEAEPTEPSYEEPAPGDSQADDEEIADPNAGLLIAHFIDVGQGDACLLELPSGETMLIDGGERSAFSVLKEYLEDQYIDRIDYLIATHPHADHIGGLIGIVDEFPIGKIYMPQVAHNTKTFEELLETIKKKGLKITAAKAGVAIETGGGFEAVFVAPRNNDYDNLNDYSAVLKLTHGQVAYLFTGDAEEASEKEMLAAGENLKAEVLKVGHHGSNTSTTQEFLAAVSPGVAVISAGRDNSYGHPHEEVMERLFLAGIEIFRTDLQGSIVITGNEQGIISILTEADYLSGG
jgi:competence protein ComEC